MCRFINSPGRNDKKQKVQENEQREKGKILFVGKMSDGKIKLFTENGGKWWKIIFSHF